MSEVNTRWFQDRIDDRGMSQRKLAKLMGLDPSALSLMLNGKRGIKMTEAATLSSLLGVSLDDVLFNAGIERPRSGDNTVSVTGTVDADGEVKPKEGKMARVPQPPGMPESSTAVRLEDPRSLHDGWTFYYVPRNDVQADCVGRYCVVRLTTGQTLVRLLRKGYSPGCYSLVGLTGSTVEDVRVAAAAPILWIAT